MNGLPPQAGRLNPNDTWPLGVFLVELGQNGCYDPKRYAVNSEQFSQNSAPPVVLSYERTERELLSALEAAGAELTDASEEFCAALTRASSDGARSSKLLESAARSRRTAVENYRRSLKAFTDFVLNAKIA